MPCTVLPTGPCTLTSDGTCLAPRSEAALPSLEGMHLQGHDSGFTMTWDIGTSYPGQVVTLLYRPKEYPEHVIKVTVPRDDGTITVTGCYSSIAYRLWYRIETVAQVSPWSMAEAHTDDAWDSNSIIVEHLGDQVFHGTDLVLTR